MRLEDEGEGRRSFGFEDPKRTLTCTFSSPLPFRSAFKRNLQLLRSWIVPPGVCIYTLYCNHKKVPLNISMGWQVSLMYQSFIHLWKGTVNLMEYRKGKMSVEQKFGMPSFPVALIFRHPLRVWVWGIDLRTTQRRPSSPSPLRV